MQVKGVEVKLCDSHGKFMVEHDIADDGHHSTKTAYVEATSGTSFSLKYTCLQDFPKNPIIQGLVFYLYLDGVFIRNAVTVTAPYSGSVNGVLLAENGRIVKRSFEFSDIQSSAFNWVLNR